MKIINSLKCVLFGVLAIFIGCVAPQNENPQAEASSALPPLKVAVYVDDGTRTVGVYHWLQLISTASNVEAIPVDGKGIRSGALNDMDVIIMPGGRASYEGLSLGDKGRENLTKFIKDGGGYIGSCAGCYLLMQSNKYSYLKLLPFVDNYATVGSSYPLIQFNEKATQLAGIPAEGRRVRYAGGPLPVPTAPVEGTSVEVVATYAKDAPGKPEDKVIGRPAALAGTHGDGKFFVFSVHPESDWKNHDLVKGAFRYVTGRELSWPEPKPKKNSRAIGFMFDQSIGVETAKLVQKLVRGQEFDIVPLNSKYIAAGALDKLDIVLAPNSVGEVETQLGLYGKNAKRTNDFIKRGGRVYAWGASAKRAKLYEKSVTIVKDSETALEAVRNYDKTKDKPLRIAVFLGNGARGIGAFRWLQIATSTQNATAFPVDGETIRAGALDNADVLIMPGGWSVSEAKTLQKDGVEKLKAFIKRGGGYVGTCAGCCLFMQPTKCHPGMIGMMPFKFGPAGGHSEDMAIEFNERAEQVAGIKKGKHYLRYSGGPVLVPTQAEGIAKIEVMATYAGDINATSSFARESMAGRAAAVAGEYGKGRFFVLAIHPENYNEDHDVLQGAFRYVTGRDLKWYYPQRKKGQLAVGIMCDDSLGVKTGQFVQRLLKDGEFDIVPLSKEFVSDGDIRHIDALLVPDTHRIAGTRSGVFTSNKKITEAFIKRGGRVIAWGNALEGAKKSKLDVTMVDDADGALKALRDFAKEPVAKVAPIPEKVKKPVRCAFYHDKGGSNVSVAKMLSLSPEFDVEILSAADYSKTGLKGFDMVFQPGGSAKGQYLALGTNGVQVLENFVKNGGKYYGVCAGAFLALQQSRPEFPRLGLVPFKGDDPSHYRGTADTRVKLTKEGLSFFEGSATNRYMIYYGGPALIKGTPIEDTDIKVLGNYAGCIINSSQPKPIEPMKDKGAFVAGRVGKGRIFLSCPHPEKSERLYDLVKGGIKYLTGVSPSIHALDRVRGAVSVRYAMSDAQSARFYFNKLIRDRRIDVLRAKDYSNYANTEVLVLTDPESHSFATLREFMFSGGKVVILADTPAEEKYCNAIKGAVVVDSYDKIIPEILK